MAEIPFVKMHGAGNDYVLVDGFRIRLSDPVSVARRISERRFGVGSDGLIIVEPSEVAHARMRMWNADGSEAGMCGNGVRLAAKLAWEAGYAGQAETLRLEVGLEHERRVLAVELLTEAGCVRGARVEMGCPRFRRGEIPVTGDPSAEAIEIELTVEGNTTTADERSRSFVVSAVGMGNPHAVIFCEQAPDDLLVRGMGPRIEHHAFFPERANVSWAHCVTRRRVELRVWERGSGETLACGSGASATVAAGIRTGRLDRSGPIEVELPGGRLEVMWPRDDAPLVLSGPAERVFEGVFPWVDGGG